MNSQRKLIYNLRQAVLEWRDLRATMQEWMEDVIALAIEEEARGEDPPAADALRRLVLWARQTFLVELTLSEMEGLPCSDLENHIIQRVVAFYDEREKELGEQTILQPRLLNYTPEELALPPEAKIEMVRRKLAEATGMPLEQLVVNVSPEAMRQGQLPSMVEAPRKEKRMRLIERFVMLDMIDSKWKDHLHNMDVLREGIYLRSYAQKDPKIEYKREGFDLFQDMFVSMKRQAASMLFKLRPTEEVEQQKLESVWNEEQANLIKEDAKSAFDGQAADGGGSAEMRSHSEHGGEQIKAVATIRRTERKIGPNDPCPCGSGRKYKKCCGRGGASRGPADHKGRVELGG